MSAEFRAGDVVRLKSGGQKMTIYGLTEGGDGTFVDVSWFNGADVAEALFPEVMLERVDEIDGPEDVSIFGLLDMVAAMQADRGARMQVDRMARMQADG